MAVTIYGIKNCDTMKKARAWLDARGVAYAFHDYKTLGIERDVSGAASAAASSTASIRCIGSSNRYNRPDSLSNQVYGD